MKKNKNLGYLIRQGFRNIWVNKLMSFASVSVLVACLLLVGSAVLLYVNIQAGIEYVGSMGEIALFVDDSMTDTEIGSITRTLENMPELTDVRFISREEGLEQLKEEITGGEELFEMLGSDVLPNAYRVRVKDPNEYEDMVRRLSQIYGIYEVVANGKIANTLADLSSSVALFGAVTVTVMLVVSVFILTNTIKLAMYSRRREIYIMKMVGATNAFIRVPFFVEGVALGFLSAIISFIVIRLAYVGIEGYLATISVTPLAWESLAGRVFLFFMLIGFFAGLLSCSVSMRKYLRG